MIREYKTSDHSDMCHWGGYALTQGFFYPTERSYMLVCPQMMSTTPGAFAFGQTLIRDKIYVSVPQRLELMPET